MHLAVTLPHPPAGSYEAVTVGAEHHPHRMFRVSLPVMQGPTAPHVPHGHGPVPAGRSEALTVGAKGHAAGLPPRVGVFTTDQLAGPAVPDLEEALMIGRGDP